MYVVVPNEPYKVDTYGVIVQLAEDYPDIVYLNASYNVEDYVDTTAPTVSGLHVTDEVFTNRCGAKALTLEVDLIDDDFINLWRFPILVTLRGGGKEFTTVTGSFRRSINDPVYVAKAPYLGDCLTDEGLEALEFTRGERVEVTMVVYDYATVESDRGWAGDDQLEIASLEEVTIDDETGAVHAEVAGATLRLHPGCRFATARRRPSPRVGSQGRNIAFGTV